MSETFLIPKPRRRISSDVPAKPRVSSDGSDRNDSIKVAIRLKPVATNEREKIVWSSVQNSVRTTVNNGTQYTFDKVYGPSVTNNAVFEDSVKTIVAGAINGYNGTVFAYGQTASGKTHTMKGTSNSFGMIPLAVKHVVNCIENTPDRNYLIRVSYMEIYNECIRDLLEDSHADLKLYEKKDGIAAVSGLKEVDVNSETEILNCFNSGEKRRSVGATSMNERSSRSHTIFKMVIENQLISTSQQGGNDVIVISHLNFVDLAGSEKVGQMASGNNASRFKEGCNINLSLLALSQVIRSLSEGKTGHINYRDSKLTRILQGSLGGNAQTAVICTITPTEYDESLSTLKFADRAKVVKNKPRINKIQSKDSMLNYYENVIDQLQIELQTEKESKLPQELMQKELELKDTRITQLEEKLNVFQQKLFVPSSRSFSSPSVKKVTAFNRRTTWCAPTAMRKTQTSIFDFPPSNVHTFNSIVECLHEDSNFGDAEEDFGTGLSVKTDDDQKESFKDIVTEDGPSDVRNLQKLLPFEDEYTPLSEQCEPMASQEQPVVSQVALNKLNLQECECLETSDELAKYRQLAENAEERLSKLTIENNVMRKATEMQAAEAIKLKTAMQEIENLRETVSELNVENDSLRKTIEQQALESVKMKASMANIKDLELCISDLNANRDEMQVTIQTQTKKLEKLEICLSTLTADNEVLQQTQEHILSGKEIECQDLKQNLQNLEGQLNDLKIENQSLKQTFEQQNDEITTLTASNETLEGQVNDLRIENQTLKHTFKQKNEEITTLIASNEHLEGQLNELRIENQTLKQYFEQQNEEITTLTATNEMLLSRVDAVGIELNITCHKQNEAAMKADTLKHELGALQLCNGKLTVENDEMRKTIELHMEQDGKLKSSTCVIEKLEININKLTADNKVLQMKCEQQVQEAAKIRASKQEIENLCTLQIQKAKESFEQKLADLEKSFAVKEDRSIEIAVESAIEGAMALLDEERAKNAEARRKYRQSERDVEMLRKKIEDLKSSVNSERSQSLQSSLNASNQNEELDELKKKYNVLSEDVVTLRDKQLQTDKLVKELNNELFSKDCELNKLQMYIKTEEAPFKEKIKYLEEECRKRDERNKQLQLEMRSIRTDSHNSTVAEFKHSNALKPNTGRENIPSSSSSLGMVGHCQLEYVQAENQVLRKEVIKLRSLFQQKPYTIGVIK